MSYRFGSSPNSHHRSIAVVVGMDDTTITTRLEPKTDGRSIAADRENRPPPLSLSTSMNIINNPTTRDNNNNNSEPPRSRGCGAEEEPNTTHNGWNSDMSLDTEGSLEDAPSASITIPTAAATTTAAVAEPNLPLVSTSSSPRTAPPRPTTTAVTTATLLDWKEPIRFNLTPLLPTLPKKTISSSSACTNKSNSANNHNNYSGNAPKSPHSSSSLVILEPPAVSITTNTIRSSDAATTRHQRPSMRLPPLTTTTRPNHHNSPAGMAASARGIPDSHQPEPEQPPPKLPTVVAQSQPSDPVHSSTTGGGLMLQSSNVRHFASSTLKATTPNKPPMVALSLVRCGGDHKPLSTHHTRPPLLVLKSFGLGKAARVDPSSQSAGLLDDSDSDGGEKKDKHVRPTPTGTTATTSSRRRDPLCHETTPPKKKTKLVKMDIDYMLNWDPEKRLATPQQKQQQHPDSLPQVTQQQQQQPQLLQSKSTLYGTQPAKISQQTPSVSLSSSSNTASGTSSSSSLSLSHGSNKEPSVVAAAGHSTSSGANSILAAESQKDNSVAARLTQANVDFLPLVLEENMIRVNGVPYAKLGVIGKGGSCKVYRALSKDLTVLAIKKVKLDDLDKKAIDGYSNEIALLKRLRGNPSIIQLHDSEVDRERKAIYLVMEQGEADLNHVLQRQTLGVGGSTKRNLDMNFIRLTWQQMLRAVHSIHEERIIHGDLKPANFLFVRGSLKLIDFGIAKAIQNDDTTNIYRENQIGTLNYMSPESILDSGTSTYGQRMKCGRPSDIWSLGCILYQMIYGKTPFAELHMIQKLQAIVNPNHEVKYPSVVNKAAIDAVKVCLRRDPQERAPIVGTNGLLNAHVFLNARVSGEDMTA